MVLLALSVLALVVGVFVASGSALATLDALTESKSNEMTVADVQVSIVENGSVVEGTNTVSLGDSAKTIKLEVPSGHPAAVVRCKFAPPTVSSVEKDAQGNDTVVAQAYNQGSSATSAPNADGVVVSGDFVLHLSSSWQDGWFYHDGWFYAKKVVQPGQSTPVLLEGVTCSGDASPDGTIQVDVTADAIQETPADAPSAWGLKVQGEDVSLQ